MNQDPTPTEGLHLPLWQRVACLLLGALALSMWVWWPVIQTYPATSNGDGQYFHRIMEAARASVLGFHEWPLWNPYECGGVPLWDNPQSIIAAPLMWLAMPLGTSRAVQAWCVLHGMLGFVGMWLLARHELLLGRGVALVISAVWAFCGFPQHHLSGGHLAFAAFAYFPLALLLWRRAAEDVRFAIGLGWLLAWMMFEGAVYPLPHLAVLLGLDTLARLWPARRASRVVLAAVVAVGVALSVGALRFFPVVDQILTHTRSIPADTDALKWSTFWDMFLSRHHGRDTQGQQYAWTEYGTYIGPVVLALGLLGILINSRRHPWLLVLLAAMTSLMVGNLSPNAPWTVLRAHVFPFKEMRVPSRFRLEVCLLLLCFAGLALETLIAAGRRRLTYSSWREPFTTLALALPLLAAGDVMSVGMDTTAAFFTSAPERDVTPSERLYIGGQGMAAFLDQPRQHRGRGDCWDEWAFGQGAPIWHGDEPQARAVDDGVRVERVVKTQNTVSFHVDASRPSRVLVNSTFDLGWTTNHGVLVNDRKALALDVPAGSADVVVRYWPRTMNVALLLTLLGVPLSLWALRRIGRLRVQRA